MRGCESPEETLKNEHPYSPPPGLELMDWGDPATEIYPTQEGGEEEEGDEKSTCNFILSLIRLLLRLRPIHQHAIKTHSSTEDDSVTMECS